MRDNRLRLQDIVDATNEIENILDGVKRKEFLENRILQAAVILAVWNVVKKDLPELKHQIKNVLDIEFGRSRNK
jgi:uncharacterized protein with HEPN domain